MANAIAHPHFCANCGKVHICDFPECISLTGFQRLCGRCSYLYGWAKARDRDGDDWSAL